MLADPKSSDSIRRGSAGVVGSTMLLKSYQRMHAPFTQVSLKSIDYFTILLLVIFSFFFYEYFIFSQMFKNATDYRFLVIIVGGTTHDRRHAWRTAQGCWSLRGFICKLIFFISNISKAELMGLNKGLFVILLQNFSAQLERDILSSGNKLQFYSFIRGWTCTLTVLTMSSEKILICMKFFKHDCTFIQWFASEAHITGKVNLWHLELH